MSVNRKLVGKRPSFRPKRGYNFYRIMLWILLILVGLWVLIKFRSRSVEISFGTDTHANPRARIVLYGSSGVF